jgi:hypothetical protein
MEQAEVRTQPVTAAAPLVAQPALHQTRAAAETATATAAEATTTAQEQLSQLQEQLTKPVCLKRIAHLATYVGVYIHVAKKLVLPAIHRKTFDVALTVAAVTVKQLSSIQYVRLFIITSQFFSQAVIGKRKFLCKFLCNNML